MAPGKRTVQCSGAQGRAGQGTEWHGRSSSDCCKGAFNRVVPVSLLPFLARSILQAAGLHYGNKGAAALMAGWKNNPNERKHVATNRRRK